MANHKLNFRWSNVSVAPRVSSSFLIVRRAYTSTVIVRSSFYRRWHVIIISIIRYRFFLVVVVILVATWLLIPLFSINKNLLCSLFRLSWSLSLIHLKYCYKLPSQHLYQPITTTYWYILFRTQIVGLDIHIPYDGCCVFEHIDWFVVGYK